MVSLFALDCIDFNSDFCHIDTLSDIAMLAVDMQQVMYASGVSDAEKLISYFLEEYLREMQENDAYIQPLLRYYMTEKAMICSYVSILFNNSPVPGKNFLTFAHQLAQRLEESLVSSTSIPPSHLEIAIQAI